MGRRAGARGPISFPSRRSDLVGAAVSILCIIHCIALPMMAVGLPALAAAAEGPLVHEGLAILTFLASVAVLYGCRPTDRTFFAAALFGNAAVLYAAFGPLPESLETPVTVSGAVLLASAHIFRLARPRRSQTKACA